MIAPLINYLYILYRFVMFLWQFSSGSSNFVCVPIPIPNKTVPIHFVECGVSLMYLYSHVGRFPQGWKRNNINQWVPYIFGPLLKIIYHTTLLYSGIHSHWVETLNYVACSRLRTMLYLEIKKRKIEIKAFHFQKYIAGTAACMRINMKANKGCGQLLSKWHLIYWYMVQQSEKKRTKI